MSAHSLALPDVRQRPSSYREWIDKHPEWWTLAASLCGWILIGLASENSTFLFICSSQRFDLIETIAAHVQSWPLFFRLGPEFMGWLLMIVAMMLPLTIASVRHVAFRSFAWRRDRAIACFLLGYLAVWAFVGVALMPFAILVRSLGDTGSMFYMLFGVLLTLGWQLTAMKSRALRRCHRTATLSPRGWRADLDCLRFGLAAGGNCVVSCWALMTTLFLGYHGLLLMACAQAIVAFERYQLSPRDLGLALILLQRNAILLFR